MDRTAAWACAHIAHLPHEALMIIVQMVCRRQAVIGFGTGPTDPSCHDETVEMWIEDCAARRVLVWSRKVFVRRTQVCINILSITAVCRLASLSKLWCCAVDGSFKGEYFLLFKEVEPSTWDYIRARWVNAGVLNVVAESKYIDLLLLAKRRG